ASPATSAAGNQRVSVIVLEPANCLECFSFVNLTTELFPGDFEQVSFADQKGKDLVAKYSISKLPALIILNESKVTNEQLKLLLVRNQDAMVLEAPIPLFFEVATGKVKGKVTSFSISPANCVQCVKASDFIGEVKANQVTIENRNLAADSQEAKDLIAKYNVKFLPAFILSSDLLEYPSFKQAWSTLGSVESDGFLVMRQPFPPYVNISNNKVEGLVSAIYLTDNSCPTCYNVSIHKAAMKNYNVFIVNETYVGVASLQGKALVVQYNVTKVPTVILSKEANVYGALMPVWQSIGSVESDGVLVFREFDTVPGLIYKNLLTNSTITVNATNVLAS
ncbi:MAG: hypothetical protein V1644_02280, partial [Candidatus Micrarchaeota archaeon]